jgi:uncharacterized membrane protein YcaP (DUF421 family)
MDLVFRAIAMFAFMYLLTRIMGRRELGSLEPFDLILLIVLGDSIQQGLTQDDYSVTGAVIAVGTIAVLQLLVSYSSFRFRWARSFLSGHPIVLVQDGEVIERNLKRERITHEELAEQARGQQITSIKDIQWAVFEPGGTISFIPKKQ